MLTSLYLHSDALKTDPDSCPPEVKPRPMKTIYIMTAKVHDNCTVQFYMDHHKTQ